MSFTIRPAQRSDSKALIGLYGQSGAGKTFSALLLARGLVGPTGKIVLIDTESRRGSLYADVIPGGYDTIDLDAPFSPDRYIQAIEAAEATGAQCIIVDSMSHEWEGIGGVGDMALQIEQRTGKPGLHCWKEPKLAHQKMLLKLLQAKTHVICCLRAKRKSRQIRNERTGKNEIVKDEFYTPKQDGDFIFELTVHAEVQADHALRVTKVSHPALEALFKTGVKITEDTGRKLAEWAAGKVPSAAPPAPPPPAAGWPDFKSLNEWVAWSRPFLATANATSAANWNTQFAPQMKKLDENGQTNAAALQLRDELLDKLNAALLRGTP